jgi:aryl-alcohol dehydrogenase-like predicted oxidoreductase
MQLTSLGQTGLKVSRIGLGLAALGRPGYLNLGHSADLAQTYDVETMETRARQVLDAAYQQGIRYFDAARSYGKAEQFLASWLKLKQPSNVVVGSKWGYIYTADWQVQADKHEVKEHSRENLEKQFSESISLLGNYLNLYQIHSVTLESGVLENNDVLEKLSDIKQRGIKIGLSLSGVKQAEALEKALRVERGGSRLFDTVQATYNLLETSAGKTLELAHREGMGIIIKEALANGRLTERNQSPNFADKLLRLQRCAEHYGATLDAFALASVLQQPWVDVVLSGATTIEQLTSNLKAIDVAVLLDLEDFSEMPEMYWEVRSRLAWN